MIEHFSFSVPGCFLLSLAASGCISMQSFSDAEMEFDEFGGVSSMKGKTTGAFHIEKINGRDCLVTPDGHGFFSLGVVHISAIAQKSEIDVFTEKYGRDWQKVGNAAWANLTAWGFNSAGYGAPRPLRQMAPYIADSFTEKASNFLPDSAFFYPDVFDPDVRRETRKKIRLMCEKEKGNPNLIGFYWTDTPQWDLKRSRKKRGTDWVSSIRALPANAPGKKRYVEFLLSRYESAKETAETYGLIAVSVDGLLQGNFQEIDWGVPKIAEDDREFLRLIAREHYRTLGEETRKHAPKSLIFGERYLMCDHPDEVIEEALPYIDALAIQPSGSEFDGDFFDRLHKQTGKPILLCDHQCSFATPEYSKTMWKQLESEEAVGKAYQRYVLDAVERPYILGYHRCQYIDRFAAHPGVLKQGLLRHDETPYETLVEYTREGNAEAIERFSKWQAK